MPDNATRSPSGKSSAGSERMNGRLGDSPTSDRELPILGVNAPENERWAPGNAIRRFAVDAANWGRFGFNLEVSQTPNYASRDESNWRVKTFHGR